LLFLFILSLLAVSDATLYKFWGFRLDSTPLLYLKTPKEAFASVSTGLIIKQVSIALVIFAMFVFIFRKWFKPANQFKEVHYIYSPVMLLFIAALIIPIRGGFGIAPMNVGTVYFSNKQFLNHASINIFWNVGFSLIESQGIKNNYAYFKENEIDQYRNVFENHNLPADSILLSNEKPNIIVLIIESFTAKVIEPLGGVKNIAPQFNQLCSDGLLFTNFYANGDRSDKGLIAILSGYPAQTTTSIIKYASKTRTLPRLGSTLQKNGYYTAFYYGGDIDFANMRSYLLDSKFNSIISKDSFPTSTYNSKWGAHDQFVFEKLRNNIPRIKQPFFITLFTLSSHEPFEVPGKNIDQKDEESLFLHAINYTDSCLGDFIMKAKKESWWNNTLLVVVADHGHRFPGLSANYEINKYKIPMLWLGGALKSKGKISKLASQNDIASTLLSQLNISSNDYIFSKNIIGKQPAFAYYVFNNGFGIIKDSSAVIFDCTSNEAVYSTGTDRQQIQNIGKAYIQDIYTDLENR
jgi:phosphoglycerol transferase MdoB-like AlkP superfamily enzyme